VNETQLRDRLHELARDAPRPSSMPSALGRRAARRVVITVVSSVLLVGAIFAGGVASVRAFGSGRSQPVQEPTEAPEAQWLPVDGPLTPGTYRFLHAEQPSLQVTLTVPAGWEPFDVGVLRRSSDSPRHMGVLFEFINGVYADPCRSSQGFVHVGPAVEDLATALASQPRRHGTTPTGVTFDGYAGEYVELTVPAHIDFRSCEGGTFDSWLSPGGSREQQGPGQHDELWILDVDGIRLVMDATFMPGTTAADRAELARVVASVHIERVPRGTS
jgi:hypothetical protein